MSNVIEVPTADRVMWDRVICNTCGMPKSKHEGNKCPDGRGEFVPRYKYEEAEKAS